MYQPVTDRSGQVTGYSYTDAQGRQQFVPAVGMQTPRNPMQRMQMGMQASRFGGQVAAPSMTPQQGFMFGGNVAPPAPPAGMQQPEQQRSAGGSPMYQKFYSKFSGMGDELRGNVEAMASGAGLPPTEADYRRGERRQKMDMRDAAQQAKRQAQAMQGFANPYLMLDGWAEGSIGNATQDWYREQPLTELTFLMQGASGRDRFSDNSRRFGNAVNRTASMLAAGNDPTYDTLMANLFNPGNNSAVGRSFQLPEAGRIRYDQNGIYQGQGRTTWDWAPAATQADQMRRYLQAIYQTSLRPSAQTPAMSYVNRLIDQWAAQHMNKNSAPPIFRWLGQRLGY